MNIHYISWEELDGLKIVEGSLYSIEVNPQLLEAGINLYNTYIDDQSKAVNQFGVFQKIILDIMSTHNGNTPLEDAILNDLLVEVEWIVEEPLHDELPYLEAQLINYTHLISARLAFLITEKNSLASWLDPRDVILTDEDWLQAAIDDEGSRKKILSVQQSNPIVTTHSIGASSDNQNTLTRISRYWENLFEQT